MPSRQGRLDTTYFSSSQQDSSSRNPSNGSQRQTQSQTQKRARAKVERSEENDSEGSEGMNAIRLSASPDKKKKMDPGGKGNIVDLISDDDDDDEEVEEGGYQDTELSVASSSKIRPAPLNLVDNGLGDDVDSPLTSLPSSKRTVPLSSTSTAHRPISASVPKKRLDLTSGTLAFPLLPVPTNFTRLGTVPETPASSSRRQYPYIELIKWTDEQKSQYTHYPIPSRVHSEQPDNLSAFLGPDMVEIPDIPMSMPTVYEVVDSEDDVVPIPPPKRRALLAVEIPTRRSQSVQNGSQPSSSRRRHDVRGSDDIAPVSKKGKGRSTKRDSDSESELPRLKGSSKARSKARKDKSEEDDDEDGEERRSKKAKDKGKGKARLQDDSDNETGSESRPERHSKKDKKRSKQTDPGRSKKSQRKEREPSLTRREYLDELELEESTRFKTDTRLRKKKETPQQRMIRKLKDKRKGIVRPDTPSEDSEDSEDTIGDTSDSAADSRGGHRRSDSFFASDDGEQGEVILPHEFSSNSAQTPEFKFKVVFQYFTLLAVCGPGILPLRGEKEKYFIPQLRDLRRKMDGHKEGRVRSQIWPRNYVKALQAYPEISLFHLNVPEEHCLACNRTNYKSSFRLELRGNTYDPETYEPLPDAKQKRKLREAKRMARKAKAKKREERRRQHSETPSSKGSDSSSDSGTTSEEDDVIKPKDEIFLGPHCKKRSILFHSMAHWEWILLNRIQSLYHDLLRAKKEDIDNDSDASPSESDSDLSDDEKILRKDKRKIRRDQTRMRVKRLRSQVLPTDPRNADAVQEWMDRQQYVLTEWKWMEDLEDQSKRLEFDRNKDE